MQEISIAFRVPTREEIKTPLPQDTLVASLVLQCREALQLYYKEGEECSVLLGQVPVAAAQQVIEAFEEHGEDMPQQWKVIRKQNSQGLVSQTILVFSAP